MGRDSVQSRTSGVATAMKIHTRQVAEGERLELPAELDTPRMREQLLRAGETDVGSAFRHRAGGLYARDLVGVVSTRRIQVQIVPKVSSTAIPEEESAALLQLFLHSGLPVRAAAISGSTAKGRYSLAEALMRHVAEHIHRLLLTGVPRRYAERAELSDVVRGRVDLPQLARRRPGMEHLVPVRHAPLQHDNDLARVARAVVRLLASMTRSARTKELLERSDHLLHAARLIPLTRSVTDRVILTRLERDWIEVVEFARMLAVGSTPDVVRPGTSVGFTLVFPLHLLFEALLRATLRAALRGSPLDVAASRSAGNLWRRDDGREGLGLRPDLMFGLRTAPDPPVLVGDVKWKRITPQKAGLGIDPSDAYQLVTYMQRLRLTRALLFFPARDTLSGGDPALVHELELLPGAGTISVVEVDVRQLVSNDERVRAAAATRIAGITHSCATGASYTPLSASAVGPASTDTEPSSPV